MELALPTTAHEAALSAVLSQHRPDANITGILVCGSLAHGTARPDSDVDLILVLREERDWPTRRRRYSGVVVEQLARTFDGWIESFSPSRVGDESWGYAFIEGVALSDPKAVIRQLADAARQAHASYRTPDPIKEHFSWMWEHARPKMEAVLRTRDTTEIGWAAAVLTDPIVQTLWAINDLPLPSRDLGYLHRHLDDLKIPSDAPALIREMLEASPEPCLQRQLRILDLAMRLLIEHSVR